MIAVPLLLKELRSTSRRWTTFVVRCLYVGIAALILWMFLLSQPELLASPSQFAHVGRQLFWSINALQITAALIGAMLGCSDAVTGEVRRGTLGLLLMTPLTPFRVVLGKWVAVIVQTLLLLLAGAPALAVCLYLGGAGLGDLLSALGICLLSAGFGGAVALHASSAARNPTRAFFSAFLRLILLYFLWSIVVQAVFFAVAMTQAPAFFFALIQWTGLGLMAALVPLSLWLAARNTRKRLTAPERWNATTHSYDTKPSYYSKRLVIQGGVWEGHPLLWKDLATRSSGRMSAVGRIVIGSLVGVVVMMTTFAANGRTTGHIHFFWFILLLLALAQGSSLFSGDNSGRRWDMLLTSPLTSGRIVGSKLLAGLLGAEAIAAVAVLLLPQGAYFFARGPADAPPTLALSTLCFLAFAYTLAAFWSLHTTQSRNAFMGAGFVVGLLLIVPLIFSSSGTDGLHLVLRALNPPLLFEDTFEHRYAYEGVYSPDPLAARLPFFLLQWSLYAGTSAVLVMLACRRLRGAAAAHA